MSTIYSATSRIQHDTSAGDGHVRTVYPPMAGDASERSDGEVEMASEPDKWRAHLTPRSQSPELSHDHYCRWQQSHTDPVCWATAEPTTYYAHARVDLTQLEVADHDGNTWVHRATKLKNADVVVDLLDRLDNRLLNHQNYRGLSPLHCAAGRDAVDVTLVLLLRGADVTSRDAEGNTALAVACMRGASACLVELLIDHPKTDVNAINYLGDTPLMSVIAEHHNHLIDTLMLAPGIDWLAKNRRGQSLTQLALSTYNICALALIVGFLSGPSDSQSSDCCPSDDDSDCRSDMFGATAL